MGKELWINCGRTLLLYNHAELFERYEKVIINTGRAAIHADLWKTLQKLNVSANSGNLNILDINGKIKELDKNSTIGEKDDFTGQFIVSESDLIIEAKGKVAARSAQGFYVCG